VCKMQEIVIYEKDISVHTWQCAIVSLVKHMYSEGNEFIFKRKICETAHFTLIKEQHNSRTMQPIPTKKFTRDIWSSSKIIHFDSQVTVHWWICQF
jgi:hypothetical protein